MLMEGAAEDLPALHPSMADRYRKEVTNLIDSLNDQENRTEAATLLRKLIDKIVLKPDPDGPGLLIDLHGDLAGILTMAAKNGKSLTPGDLSMLQESVALSPSTGRAKFSLYPNGRTSAPRMSAQSLAILRPFKVSRMSPHTSPSWWSRSSKNSQSRYSSNLKRRACASASKPNSPAAKAPVQR